MKSTFKGPTVTISAKAEKSLLRRHPWVFSRAVQQVGSMIGPGQTVAVLTEKQEWLAWAAYSPNSQIRLRIWSFDPADTIDADFFLCRLKSALEARQRMALPQPCTARRLVNAESDGLPGLIVDQYGDFLVCQFLSAGAEQHKGIIVDQLQKLLAVQGIYERSDAEVRFKEGLPLINGLLRGTAPPDLIEVRIDGIRLLVDLPKGHKTGLYLDQRENQARLCDFAAGAEVLNCFSYTGAFGIWALRAGAAQVTNIDSSADILALAERNLSLNAMAALQVNANVFEQLRRYRDSGRQFDVIVLDPPKFVAAAGQMTKGCRGYKDINLLAFKLLRPGGVLFTFSCSGLVSAPLFQKIVADAAVDAGRRVQVLAHLSQAADHPVALNFPEGHYLKGLICLAE